MQEKIITTFENIFQMHPRCFIAPGRINLIGEHTDYNGGFVMPAAIDKHFTFAINTNLSDEFCVHAFDLNESINFSNSELKPGLGWQHYLMGVIDGLIRRGKIPQGIDCVFGSTIPAGAGLSSSAALCSGFGFALNELFGFGLDRLTLAEIAKDAEHHFAGVKVGIMDMYASLFSEDDTVMLLDCRSCSHEYLPLRLGDHEILLVDTKVKHALASSDYNDRRAACEEGVKVIQSRFPWVTSLREATQPMLEEIKPAIAPSVFRRCRYVISETERTQIAAGLLRSNELQAFGRLMYETHWGLSKDYEVSCEASDWLVTLAEANAVTGARQMGGGFGGCTINLITRERRPHFEALVREKYFARFKKEPEFYSVNLARGVREVAVD